MTSTALPQVAYAASASDGDGEGIVDTVKGWFADDDEKDTDKPPSHDGLGIADRQKLPKGKAAEKPKRVAELTNRRTANARYWKLSDGRVQAEVSAVPTAYRAGKSWKDVDPTLTPARAKGFDFANTTNVARSWFGSDASRLLRFEAGDGHAVTVGLQGAGRLVPVAKGDTVTYRDAVTGADLSYQVGPGRVKENIVLAERPAGPVSFTFTLDPDGLTPKAGKDGSVRFYGEGADPVLVIPAPFMTDAKKDAQSPYGTRYSTAVEQKLTRAGRGWKLTVTPDEKWLAAKERQYPVTVDPTIAIAPTPSTAQDVMISSDGPASNYDANWRLSVGNTSTGAARALLRFPLSGLPAGAQLDSADLKMYYDQVHTTNNDEVRLQAHRATGAWDESTATWDSANAITGELSGTSVVVDDGDSGTTAAVGSWPASGSSLTQYAVGQDYHYNKDSVSGDTYTWQPSLPEDGTYQVEAHYVPEFDRATAAPYTVTHDGGSTTYTVDQSAGSGGEWKTLGSHPFKAGTLGKVVLGDGPASTSTAVIADAVRFTKGGVVTKKPGELNTWHSFPVTKTVQSWIDGTYANHGFVVKAGDESADGPKGGPRYEASEYAYDGETANYPRLVLTFGRQGADLAPPTTIHDTGAELKWSAYQDPDPAATGDDIVEYQVHRSVFQAFTPSAATLVAPVEPATTAFTDTTAVPTRADDPDPFGRAYYYMVAVKTKDGQVIGAPTQLVRLPKAGRTTRVLTASQDTTLSSTQSTTALDTFDDGGPKHWVVVGNNSPTYGDTRTLLKFPDLGIPDTARVLDATVRLWGTQTVKSVSGALYELRPLTRDFDEATATWVKADATTNWASAGGDFGASVADTGEMTNDPARHDWSVTSLAQSWVSTPSSQKGVAIKMADEAASQERTLFLSSEGAEQRLHPKIVVTYIDSTTESTYYAPKTPSRMTPNTTYTVDFTVTNTTSSAWAAGERELSYTWKLPDGTDVTTGGNQLATAVPPLAPGDSATIQAQVKTPINSDSGNKRTEYVLGWDVRKVSDGSWLSAGTGGIPALKQNVAVEDPTSNQLGLEKFYSYTGKNTGAGSTVMNNTAAGNSVWSYNAINNPGRGLNTFFRVAYNSLDTSDTVLGHGWSAQAAGPLRLGAPLDFHPNPNPTEVKLPDGDGTTHVFRWDDTAGEWKAPAGVHFRLEAKPGSDCTPAKDAIPDAWTLMRPDGTRFLFGCDGYLTSVVDNDGNTQTFTYEERKSNNKPVKFLRYITDPAGRQSLTVDYYKKGDASYDYIDDTGAKASGTNLTNSKIYDHIKSVTDISGREITFYYTTKGLMGRMVDGEDSSQPKVFKFTYDATQGNKNVKLVTATDPRGNGTDLAYYAPQTGDDPKYHWWTKTITDRRGGTTDFAYGANATNTKFTDTTVTDAENHATKYVTDDFARPVQLTNAKSQTTKLAWDADNNVTYLEENNGARAAFCYDQKTGYPLRQWDPETTKSWTVFNPTDYCDPASYPSGATAFEYQTRADGYSANLFHKTSPLGNTWQFGYDDFGNPTSVTDPEGVATTSVPDDYMSTTTYDVYGQPLTETDAGGHTTKYDQYGPTGYPEKITDAKTNTTTFVYDERGNTLQVVNAKKDAAGQGAKVTQSYDYFGRPLEQKSPKDQAAGVFITTPAPVYDANNNILTAYAPNGAETSSVYDAADQVTDSLAPVDQAGDPERRTRTTYDKVGNVLTVTEPKGNLTATAGDYTTTYSYDEIYQPVSVVNARGDKVTSEYDNVGNLVTVIDPKKNATADTTDFTTKYAYDLNHRVVKTTDAAGKFTSVHYDLDGRVDQATDAENNTTEYTFDRRGLTKQVKVPYSKDASGVITHRTTRYEYDKVGNRTKVISPRGVATTDDTTDYTTETIYDELNRVKEQLTAFDKDDTRYSAPDRTYYFYDEVGQLKQVSAPPSQGQSVRNVTSYEYYDNGWVKS
ncbi:DNRLRE domain-containing protein, partial [Streptomyces sp. TRM68367]|uniref:DNRLRE domain-containing protein n=1 Tax=Streptomyces sp. TRM68367 TaxID=2758415 RepID=UPI002934D9F5